MNFDLDIDNYSRDELIQMFELPSNFDRNIVEIKETKLRDNINTNREIDKDTKVKTINFLIKAKNIILNYESSNKSSENFLKKNFNEDLFNSIYHTSDIILKKSKLDDSIGDHMVQIKENKPYVVSDPGEFFPGDVNPLKKRTIRQVLNIDTRFRDNYYTSPSTNFNFILPTQFTDVLQMQLTGLELPVSYNVVSKQYGNNYFSITVDGQTKIINIPNGKYSESTIINAVNNELQLAGSPFNNVSFVLNLSSAGTGSSQTLVGPIASPAGFSTLTLNFQDNIDGNYDTGIPLPLKFGWLLGFRNGVYSGNLNYVSESMVDVSGPKYFFLVLDDYNNSVNNCFYSAFNSSILNNNILARISLGGNISFLQQNNLSLTTTMREYFGPVNLTTIKVQLLDEYGRIVDLNYMDFSFCITLTVVHNI